MSESLIDETINLLEELMNNNEFPKSIRDAAKESLTALTNEEDDLFLRLSSAIEILEDKTSDTHIPLMSRTLIWEVLGKLEAIRD
ncbi:MAG: UPF0147 family protein [Methanobrevibacter sp.]|jgi:uncharacterized protein (UPF0147 family)|nr:UPF0147 family protein [Methanobrevibacter sp.]